MDIKHYNRIFEAMERFKALITLDSLSRQIKIHLIKIAFLRGSVEQNHWRKEVVTFLMTIALVRIKPKNKPLKYKDLYAALFTSTMESLEEFIGAMEHVEDCHLDRDRLMQNQSAKSIQFNWKAIQSFCDEISNKISKGQISESSHVYTILNKYF